MCLLIAKEQGTPLPTFDSLSKGAQHNSDGMGIARWCEGDTGVLIKKDFESVNHLWAWINTHVNASDALIIHFRLASSGNKAMGNRHPFPITKNMGKMTAPIIHCRYALAHNGVLRAFHSKGSTYSDTMLFIKEVVAPVWGLMDNKGVKRLMDAYLSLQKVAILSHKGQWSFYGNGWIEDKGIMYSNSTYKRFTHYPASTWDAATRTWKEKTGTLKSTTTYTYPAGTTRGNVRHLAKCEECGEFKSVYRLVSGGRVCLECLCMDVVGPCDWCGEIRYLKNTGDVDLCSTCSAADHASHAEDLYTNKLATEAATQPRLLPPPAK
jgi:hypothetical protein